MTVLVAKVLIRGIKRDLRCDANLRWHFGRSDKSSIQFSLSGFGFDSMDIFNCLDRAEADMIRLNSNNVTLY
jgi:hypothetical protein